MAPFISSFLFQSTIPGGASQVLGNEVQDGTYMVFGPATDAPLKDGSDLVKAVRGTDAPVGFASYRLQRFIDHTRLRYPRRTAPELTQAQHGRRDALFARDLDALPADVPQNMVPALVAHVVDYGTSDLDLPLAHVVSKLSSLLASRGFRLTGDELGALVANALTEGTCYREPGTGQLLDQQARAEEEAQALAMPSPQTQCARPNAWKTPRTVTSTR